MTETAIAKRVSVGLAIPTKLTAVSLSLPDNATERQSWDVGKALGAMDGASAWWKGDWSLQHAGKWSQGDIETQAAETGIEYQTLSNCRTVSNAFEFSRRREKLTWRHHATVLGLSDPDEQDEVLAWADREGKSVAETREEVRRRKREKSLLAAATESTATILRKDALQFLSDLPGASVDLLLTDPPYITEVANIKEFAASWVPLALSRVKETGMAFVFTGAYAPEMAAYLGAFGDTEAQPLVWRYDNTIGPTAKEWFFRNYQVVWYLRKPDAPDLRSAEITELFAAQTFNAPDGRLGNRYYKWQKPDDLSELYVRLGSEAGGLVVDPFAGSGSLLLAAARLGREAIGSEIDPEALKIAKARGCNIREG